MQSKRGFSLVETIVTVALMCIVSIFAYPSFMDFRAGIEVRAIISDLVADLQYAKISAIKVNRYVVIELLGSAYRVFVDDGKGGATAGDWIQSGDEKTLVERGFDSSVAISSNFKADKLRFRGVVGMKPGTITVEKENGKTYKIVISRLGRLREG
jgi:prepilin-type N-terminal cleavage/methylation domain-containing protein